MSRSPSRSISPAAGVTDHGALTGLGDDDHPQYTTTAEAQALVDTEATARSTADGLLVPKSLYDANTILAATTDNTPAALTVGVSTFVGRKATGNIAAMSVAEATTLLGVSASPTIDYITGRTFGADTSAGGTSFTVAANTMYALPFFCRRTHTFDRIGTRVFTGAGNARFGIYNAGSDGLPSSLLLDGGAVSTASNNTDGIATISQSLTAGTLYWLVGLFSSTPLVTGYNPYEVPADLGCADWGAANRGTMITRAFAYAALPDPFGTPAYGTGTAPAVRLRA